MNKDEKKPTENNSDRRIRILLCTVFAAYITVCGVMYILADANEHSSYVRVSPVSYAEEPIPESEKVNINTATAEELTKITGIGETTASRIIEYRNTYGSFLYIDELLNVNGIGEKLLKKISPYIIL